MVLGVVKKFSGDFINQKDSEGKDHGCFYIPKPRPADPAAVKSQVEHVGEPKQASPISIFYATYCGVWISVHPAVANLTLNAVPYA